MKINGKTQVMGDRVVLVPYKKCHVEKYHLWMQSPRLQELTASEPLTLEEEYEMQQSWFRDDDKCTFIVLDRSRYEDTGSEEQSMIGDTNLYLNSEDANVAEGEIMIAESDFVGQKRGWEAMLLMFRYGVEVLGVIKFQVKIGMKNNPSLCMFKKMNFTTVSTSEVFQEVTLEAEVVKMSGAIIREAKQSDCQTLLELMRQLARELPLMTSANIGCKDLENDAFGDSPIFTVYVSQSSEGVVIGYVLFYYTYSTWEGRSTCLEELFVIPSQRRKGIGSALLKKVVQVSLEIGSCRCNINTFPKNQFLISQGALDLTEIEKWLFFRMNHEVMESFVKSCKMLDGIEVREAKKSDCVGIRKLIQDLADYEEMTDGPKIDASTLEKDGHESKTFYKCFVAETEGKMVGYSLFFFTYNGDGPGVYMEDLYVSPEYRKKGIGMALWGSVIKSGLSIGGKRCDFAVLDWNTPSINFYKLKGAVDMTQEKGFHFYRMTKDVMQKYVKEQ